MPKLFIALPLILLSFLVLLFWQGMQVDPNTLPAPALGKPVPAFSLPELGAPERTITQADVKGPALLHVWGTWCSSCRQEHEELMRIAAAGKLPIYGIDYQDDAEAAQRWLKEKGNPYAFNIYDQQGVLTGQLTVIGAPETYYLDAAGIVRYRRIGPLTDKEWQEILKLLGEGSGAVASSVTIDYEQ